jgi:hypothetical protein
MQQISTGGGNENPLCPCHGRVGNQLCCAFGQQQDTVDAETAEQVRALATKYDEACNKNDAVAVAALITDNAIWITPAWNIVGSAGHSDRLC